MDKNIKVSEELHKKLNIIKIEKGYKTISEVIEELLG